MTQMKLRYLYTSNGNFTNNNVYTVLYWGTTEPIVLDDNNWPVVATNFVLGPGVRWSIESLLVDNTQVII